MAIQAEKNEISMVNPEPRVLSLPRQMPRQRSLAALLFGIGYAVLYAVLVAMIGVVGPVLKEPISLGDAVIMGLAVHKISWLLLYRKNSPGAYPEGREEKQSVFRKLFASPFFLMPWGAMVFLFGFLFLPYLAKVTASLLAVVVVAEITYLFYTKTFFPEVFRADK